MREHTIQPTTSSVKWISKAVLLNFFSLTSSSVSSLPTVLRNGAWEIVHWEKVRTHYAPPYSSSSTGEDGLSYLSVQITCLCCCVSEKPDTYSVHTYWL